MNKSQPLYIIIKIEFPVGFLPKQLAYNNHSFIVFNLSNGTCESMHDSLDSAQKKIIELLDKSEKIETGEKNRLPSTICFISNTTTLLLNHKRLVSLTTLRPC